MNPAEAVFLYLPVPYWAAFVVLLYRHDLSRLTHPVRDDGSLRNWWSVLTLLGHPRRRDAQAEQEEGNPPLRRLSLNLGRSEPVVDVSGYSRSSGTT